MEKHSTHICVLDIMKGKADWGELTLQRRVKGPQGACSLIYTEKTLKVLEREIKR